MSRSAWFAFALLSGVVAASAPAHTAERASSDRPEASDGYQIHVIYAIPKNGKDRGLDTDGTIAASIEIANGWLSERTDGTKLRLDRLADGTVDITFVRLSRSDRQIRRARAWVRDEIEKEINALGFNDPKKVYLVYYGGSSNFACAGGAWPPTLKGNTAALYLGAFISGSACYGTGFAAGDEAPRYGEFVAVHEVVHTLGLVAECAPHHTRAGHVSDRNTDLMYAGTSPWEPGEVDKGADDYFGHGVAGCSDLAKSAFVEPTVVLPELPPEWIAGARCTYLGYGKRECE